MSVLSIVIPAYNEEESVGHIVSRLQQVLKPEGINYEVVFIDDGSTDATYQKIQDLCQASDNLSGYRFTRNFGKESAIWAGLRNAAGDCCMVMDCDLQHPVEVIPEMYRLWEQGYEVVEGIKSNRGKEFFLHRCFSSCFYKIISAISGFDMRASSDYKLLDRRVADTLLQFSEHGTFFRGLSFWVGFRTAKVEYRVGTRVAGKTKWSYYGLLKYAVSNIIGFTSAPLNLVTSIGVVLLIAFFGLGIQTLVNYIMGKAQEGFTTVILLLLLIGGCVLLGLGIIGLYIARIYNEVKRRPRYIIDRSTNDK